jgi:hypothetical protein
MDFMTCGSLRGPAAARSVALFIITLSTSGALSSAGFGDAAPHAPPVAASPAS